MSHFESYLYLTAARADLDDGEWELVLPLIYESDVAKQTIIVPTGFHTDLASIPRIPLVYEALGGHANEAAVVHDYLYNTHQVDRATADAVLREACGVSGVSWWRAAAIWAGVRLGGSLYWDAPANASVPQPLDKGTIA
jgi:hypothetical protein